MATQAISVARYFISLLDSDCGDTISNLKLQKLLYYAQGFHLAFFDKPLFKEKIEAWPHGPVVGTVYHEFKRFKSSAIPHNRAIAGPEEQGLTKKQMTLLDEVYRVYGKFSAWALRNMTHEESPWKDADATGEKIISIQSLRDFFGKLVKKK